MFSKNLIKAVLLRVRTEQSTDQSVFHPRQGCPYGAIRCHLAFIEVTTVENQHTIAAIRYNLAEE